MYMYLSSWHLNIIIVSSESKRKAACFFLFVLRLLQLLPFSLGTFAQSFQLLQPFLQQFRILLAESLNKELIGVLDVISEPRDALFLVS